MDPQVPSTSALRRARDVFRKRKKLILVTFALIMLGDFIGIFSVTPVWYGEARVMVIPGPFSDMAPLTPAARATGTEPTISTVDLVEILGSRELALSLVKRCHLDQLKPPGGLRGALQAIGKWFTSLPGTIMSTITRTPPKALTPVDEAVKTLQEDREDINEEQDTSIVNVGVWGESPKLANSLANGLAELLVAQQTAASRREAEQAYQFSLRELAGAEVRVAAAQAKLKAFKEREHFSDPQQDVVAAESRLQQIRKDLDSTRADLAGARVRVDKTRAQLAEQKDTIVASRVIATNPVVKQLRSDLVTLEEQLAGLLQQKQEAHPDVQKLRAQIAQNKEKLGAEVERILDTETVGLNPTHEQLLLDSLTTDAQAQGLEARVEEQTASAGAAQKDLDSLAAKCVEFERLGADVQAATQVAQELRVAAAEYRALRNTDVGLAGTTIRIVERSAIPDEWPKDSPMVLIDIGVGFVAGVMLSFGLALFVRYWREEP